MADSTVCEILSDYCALWNVKWCQVTKGDWVQRGRQHGNILPLSVLPAQGSMGRLCLNMSSPISNFGGAGFFPMLISANLCISYIHYLQ